MKHFLEEEMIWRENKEGALIPICPDCIYHIEAKPDNNDCKNEFFKKL